MPETRMQFLAQVVDGDGALVKSGEIVGGPQFLADFHRDMRDQHAMPLPEMLDLPLTRIEEVIEVVNEEHGFARSFRCTAAAQQHVERTLAG